MSRTLLSWLVIINIFHTYDINAIVLQLNNVCSGCTRNCSALAHKSASLISAMEHCRNPLHSIVKVIERHSVYLYNTVKNLSEQKPTNVNNEVPDIPSSNVDNLCYCSVETQTV